MSHILNCCADKDLEVSLIITDFTVERKTQAVTHRSGFHSRTSLNFFRFFFNRLSCSFYCKDHVNFQTECQVMIFAGIRGQMNKLSDRSKFCLTAQ